MPCVKLNNGFVCIVGTYKAGDPPPNGYLDWHEWARVQHRAGLVQMRCRNCGKWRYPQERTETGCIGCATDPTGKEPTP